MGLAPLSRSEAFVFAKAKSRHFSVKRCRGVLLIASHTSRKSNPSRGESSNHDRSCNEFVSQARRRPAMDASNGKYVLACTRENINSLARARNDHDQTENQRQGAELGRRSGPAAAVVSAR